MVLIFCPQNKVPAPLAREVAYNAVGPISALGFKSPTLAQLMARYATDPVLSSIIADKRQSLSLIAPPTAKRRRTIKKVLIEVKFSLS
jgi:hypothetical protein